ncbi:MAG: SAM-dependent methyltransferase [Alphaproteobacteria bacterium]|nr:SAM-dependent methyltransferase [Alphaproteobacteria bacterium]
MTALALHLKELIRAEGPVSVAEYMRIVLTGRADSYYMRGEAFGAAGDFVTAPEISQIFGELIGLWCVDVWRQLGAPARFSLVELGPGRGTLMKDALRAARVAPDFLRAASVVLVEVSPALRALQRDALKNASVASLRWLDRFEDLEADLGPAIIVANEFFDALPMRQFVRSAGRWAERCVGLDDADQFVFGAAPDRINPGLIPERLRHAADGAVFELAPVRSDVARAIGARIAAEHGAVLAIDYGFAGPELGDTLQAIKGHAYADVLVEPGAADLTSHVDFTALSRAFGEGGASVSALTEQGDFLKRLGAFERVQTLKRSASAAQAELLETAYQRLTGAAAMGSLFKVLCAGAPAALRPAGFLNA